MSGSTTRLDGLDLARLIAFAGMVAVNFNVVMTGGADNSGWVAAIIAGLEGRAAATFVVLAGIGLGLAQQSADTPTKAARAMTTTLKRATFLLLIGLLNTLIFSADILHYYAFYFALSSLLVSRSSAALIALTVLINTIFIALVLSLNYDTGWRWHELIYTDFWTPSGFVRNLFFNGWHPVFPWLGFALLGIVISRLALSQTRTQLWLVMSGLLLTVVAETLASAINRQPADADLLALLTTAPLPPGPLYFIAGSGVAFTLIGACLIASKPLARLSLLEVLTRPGRQTLTLYLAHIFVGMGSLEALGLLNEQTSADAGIASLIFCLGAIFYANIWARWFKRGPVEALMRKITD